MTRSSLACILAVALALTTAVPVPKKDGIAIENVRFKLYNKSNQRDGARVIVGDAQSLSAASFDPKLPTIVFIHGWMDSIEDNVFQVPKEALLARAAYNVFGVGWEDCSRNLQYEQAVECCKQVGGYAGELIAWLNEEAGLPLENVHAMGHSLGAQAISFIKKVPVTRMTALDPASPLFAHAGPEGSLDSKDAEFVDVIHTSSGFLGMKTTIGDADFYPNGGSEQPGCDDALGTCAHSASYYYYAETIRNEEAYMAYECDSIEAAKEGSCTGTPQAPMGFGAKPEFQGIYYVNITEVPTPSY